MRKIPEGKKYDIEEFTLKLRDDVHASSSI